MVYVNDFLDFLTYQRGLSENTIRSYEYDVTEFSKWLEQRGTDLVNVRVRDIDAFSIYLRKEKVNSISSVNRKFVALKTFFKYLNRSEIVDRNPFDFVTSIRMTKSLPKYLTLQQQEAILSASNDGGYRAPWLKKRDYLMILCFIDTGLRVSELCNIETKNISLEEGTLKVMGKGRKERIAILSDRLIGAIKDYLDMVNNAKLQKVTGPLLASRGCNLVQISKEVGVHRGSAGRVIWKESNGSMLKKIQSFIEEKIRPLPIPYLFFNDQGRPLDTRHAYRIIRETGMRAGIDNLHPHVLRHSFATNLRRKRADLLIIKEAMGHASVATTEMYAHLENQEYKERLRELVN